MRTRLLATVLSLVVLVLLGLGLPLALIVADSEQQQLFLDRLTVTSRLASLAQRPLLDGNPDTLTEVLQRYQQVYGIGAQVVDQDGKVVASSPDGVQAPDPGADLSAALAGIRPKPGPLVLPWDARPMVLAEPVLVDGQVRGAVVTASPTGQLRAWVVLWWAGIAVGGLLALFVAIVLALPVVRWILRPIRELDEATGRVAEAVAGGAAFAPVAADTGPPELRKLVLSFDQMAATVVDILAAQRAFVADASHQLRNPLTALHIRLSNLDGQVEPDGTEDFEAATAETKRLSRVLEELLAMARAESASAEPVIIDASAALADRVATWRAVAAADEVELRLDSPPDLHVVAMPRAVDSTLDALLDNALKFTAAHARLLAQAGAPQGDEHLPGAADEVRSAAARSVAARSVEVSAQRSGERVVISVRDHGPGLDPAELARATDRFWRSPTHQNVTGSGLGLAIVQRVVERSGGALRLDLPDGGGLRVSIELPAAAQP